MRKIILGTFALFSISIVCFATDLYQAGTITALLKGLYQPTITVKQATDNADIGLGCGVGLGEITFVNGKCFVADPYGKVKQLTGNDGLAFFTGVKFSPEIIYSVKDILTVKQLEANIDKHLKSKNIFYAIKITGEYNVVFARSEDVDTPPYTPLLGWMKNHQHKFSYKNIKGTLVGFKCPSLIKGIGVVGYHIHFLSSDNKLGGHVLGVNIKSAKIEIQPINDLKLILPKTKEYLNADMTISGDTHKNFKTLETKK
ncbi:MAG: acetolactate decarboxylase [bacterium]|nr:acetolactate decarboxylase [bacterium]